ncbi:MAG: DUF2764 family protein [Spirochaetia bacterium]
MSQYYFTAASLPYIAFESEVPLTEEEFLKLCRPMLSDTDFSVLEEVSLHPLKRPETSNSVVNAWYNWEVTLRNELVELRAHQKSIDPFDHMEKGGEIFGLTETAREAFVLQSPLASEILLMQKRWSLLEELEIAHYFDIEKLIIYKLKLQILVRKQMMDRDAGEQRFELLYTRIRENRIKETELIHE